MTTPTPEAVAGLLAAAAALDHGAYCGDGPNGWFRCVCIKARVARHVREGTT